MDLTGLGAVSDLAKTAIDKIWPDKSEVERQQLANTLALIQGQLDINKVEAASPSLFVAGWRPFIGWICGVGLGYQFLIYPILIGYAPKIQQLDMGTLVTLLGGLLGLGTLRTVEKLNGVAAK